MRLGVCVSRGVCVFTLSCGGQPFVDAFVRRSLKRAVSIGPLPASRRVTDEGAGLVCRRQNEPCLTLNAAAVAMDDKITGKVPPGQESAREDGMKRPKKKARESERERMRENERESF